MEKRRGQKPLFAQWPSLPLLGSRAQRLFKCPRAAFLNAPVLLLFQRQITGASWTGMILLLENKTTLLVSKTSSTFPERVKIAKNAAQLHNLLLVGSRYDSFAQTQNVYASTD